MLTSITARIVSITNNAVEMELVVTAAVTTHNSKSNMMSNIAIGSNRDVQGSAQSDWSKPHSTAVVCIMLVVANSQSNMCITKLSRKVSVRVVISRITTEI